MMILLCTFDYEVLPCKLDYETALNVPLKRPDPVLKGGRWV